jgi:peroxiredoxin
MAAAGGFAAFRVLTREPADATAVHALVLPDLDGRLQPMSQWRGKSLIANFWATWCEPCREEIPLLVKAQAGFADKSVQIVGISIDSADKIRPFAQTYGINYPLVIGGLESLALMRQLGNMAQVLPFTAAVKPDGRIAQTHAGPLSDGELVNMLKRLSA